MYKKLTLMFFMVLASVLFSNNTIRAKNKPNIQPKQTESENAGKGGASGSVNEYTGTFSSAYPIEVPQANGSVMPKVAIRYNSMNGNSNCGVGWSLDVPYIERQGENGGVPTFSNNKDRFVLHMGGAKNELVRREGNLYATKQESFIKIEQLGNAPLISWKISDIKGSTYYYGSGANEQFQTGSSNPVPWTKISRWYLSKVEDVNGNEAIYTYSKFESASPYISSIRWGKNTKIASSTHVYRVDFVYQSRPDTITSYKDGMNKPLTIAKIIKNIQVRHKGQKLWSYHLAYKLSSVSNRNLLASIQKRSLNGNLYAPSTKYFYSESKLYKDKKNIVFKDPTGRTITYPPSFIKTEYKTGRYVQKSNGVVAIDVNGDALPDIIESRKTYSDVRNDPTEKIQRIFLNQGVSDNQIIFKQTDITLPAGVYINSLYPLDLRNDNSYQGFGTADNGVRFADLNGDGFLDVIQLLQKGYHNRHKSPNERIQAVFVSQKENGKWNGWRQDASWNIPLEYGGYPVVFNYTWGSNNVGTKYYESLKNVDLGVRLIDINLDGKVDLVISRINPSGEHIKAVYINNGSGWFENTSYHIDIPISFAEVEETKRTIVIGRWHSGKPKYAFFNVPDRNKDWGIRFGEMNGDGLLDIVKLSAPKNCRTYQDQKIYYNTGRGWRLASKKLFKDISGETFHCNSNPSHKKPYFNEVLPIFRTTDWLS